MPQGLHAFTFDLFGLTRRQPREDEPLYLHPLDNSGRIRRGKAISNWSGKRSAK